MKKFLSMILTVVTVFSIGCFTGCDNNSTGNASNKSTPTADNGSSSDATVEGTHTPDSEIAEMKKAFKEANVGEYVTFGHYEQDNDTSNGKEDIEWLVLEKEDDKIFVISKYILLNTSSGGRTNNDNTLGWKNCGIRALINDEFLNDAFNLKEQSLIKDTINQNELIPIGDSSGDTEKIEKAEQYVANLDNSTISTTDKVFVLSRDEIEKYFPTDESKRCALTKYAYNIPNDDTSESIRIDDKPTGTYWTRSCNVYTEIDTYDNTTKRFYSAFIGLMPNGSYSYFDAIFKGLFYGIRPAMWISTN